MTRTDSVVLVDTWRVLLLLTGHVLLLLLLLTAHARCAWWWTRSLDMVATRATTLAADRRGGCCAMIMVARIRVCFVARARACRAVVCRRRDGLLRSEILPRSLSSLFSFADVLARQAKLCRTISSGIMVRTMWWWWHHTNLCSERMAACRRILYAVDCTDRMLD